MAVKRSRKHPVRRRRLSLLRADAHCWYCGVRVVQSTAKRPPPDAATLEHLKSRMRYPGRRKNALDMTVLACLDCNAGRAKISELLHGRAEQQRRSHSPHAYRNDRPFPATLNWLRWNGLLDSWNNRP